MSKEKRIQGVSNIKILILSPYIYFEVCKEHRKNKTGFGMMVLNIASALSNCGNNTYVLTHTLCHKFDKEMLHICKHNIFNLLFHIQIKGILSEILMIHRREMSDVMILRYLYYLFDKGYVKHSIRAVRPDIVHIHGLGLGSKCYIDICKELDIPYIVTVHGLIQNAPDATGPDKAYERQFLRRSEEENITVTVISSGIKRRLTSAYYGLRSAENVTVITNGTDVSPKPPYRDIKKELGVSSSHKLCLAVGSVCSGKNQIQILRAIALMPHDFRQRVRLIIIGTICSNYPIFANIKELGLEDRIIVTGFIPQKELHNYYAAADLNILASHDEGFGLSIIEGFVYGVPSVTFSDLDAISDLYDEKAMVLCDERSDEAFSKKIRFALEKQWDREAIKEYSKKFSMESMTEKYIRVFKQEIAKHNCKKLPV